MKNATTRYRNDPRLQASMQRIQQLQLTSGFRSEVATDPDLTPGKVVEILAVLNRCELALLSKLAETVQKAHEEKNMPKPSKGLFKAKVNQLFTSAMQREAEVILARYQLNPTIWQAACIKYQADVQCRQAMLNGQTLLIEAFDKLTTKFITSENEINGNEDTSAKEKQASAAAAEVEDEELKLVLSRFQATEDKLKELLAELGGRQRQMRAANDDEAQIAKESKLFIREQVLQIEKEISTMYAHKFTKESLLKAMTKYEDEPRLSAVVQKSKQLIAMLGCSPEVLIKLPEWVTPEKVAEILGLIGRNHVALVRRIAAKMLEKLHNNSEKTDEPKPSTHHFMGQINHLFMIGAQAEATKVIVNAQLNLLLWQTASIKYDTDMTVRQVASQNQQLLAATFQQIAMNYSA